MPRILVDFEIIPKKTLVLDFRPLMIRLKCLWDIPSEMWLVETHIFGRPMTTRISYFNGRIVKELSQSHYISSVFLCHKKNTDHVGVLFPIRFHCPISRLKAQVLKFSKHIQFWRSDHNSRRYTFKHNLSYDFGPKWTPLLDVFYEISLTLKNYEI